LIICGIRNIPQSWDSVRAGNWDYQQFIGRQLDHQTIGIIGYGRLGSMFAKFCRPYGSKMLAYDPYIDITDTWINQVNDLDTLLSESQVISLHVHVTDSTKNLLDESALRKMRSDVVLVNTSRGEIVNEEALIYFLEENPDAYYATDVIAEEVRNKYESEFRKWAISEGQDQVIITPHIGGITKEATQVAWCHAARKLWKYLENR
jgi:D-3-phosphoglycerate dehydrogenase